MKATLIRIALASLLTTAAYSADTVKLIAHRGGIVDDRFAENSAPSLEAAIRRGYWMAEIDVRESKDGHLVVQHDPDFERFYGVNRNVSDMTWSEISRLRARPGNSRPLEFHELAALAKGRIQLMIDTKEPSHSEAFYSAMERALRDNGLLQGTFFIGTDEARKRFFQKARVSVERDELKAAMMRGEKTGQLYFL